MPLLAADEPPPFTIVRPQGTADFVLACDHASRRIPKALGTLGLSDADLTTHVAWDIGAARVAEHIAAELDATLILQGYSRLVIDCNRPPGAPTSIPPRSERTEIPGNVGLALEDIAARRVEIFEPYHSALRAILDERAGQGRRTLLVAVHSFTPVYHGVERPWHVGLMYRHDTRIADKLIRLLRQDEGLTVGDNEPYAITDVTDYTLPTHGESRGIAHVGIETRQDLITNARGQKEWGERLAVCLAKTAAALAD
jgi:predicted N-formylglutamate amidohydrolase